MSFRGAKSIHSQDIAGSGADRPVYPAPRVRRGWEPSAGIYSSLYARPHKAGMLYAHKEGRVVMRATAFSCMCARSRGTTGNSIFLKSRQYSVISSAHDQEGHAHKSSTARGGSKGRRVRLPREADHKLHLNHPKCHMWSRDSQAGHSQDGKSDRTTCIQPSETGKYDLSSHL